MTIEVPQTSVEPLPPGFYNATVEEITAEEGQFGPQIKFVFALTDPDHNDRTLFGWCSQKFNTHTKLYAWSRGMLGNDIDPGYTWKSSDFLGLSVVLTVSLETKKDDPNTEINRITVVKRAQFQASAEPDEIPV